MSEIPNRVLIIDDDEELVELLSEYLRREGLQTHVASDGESGVQHALSGKFAVAVLDVMLPGIGGFEVLRRIRATPGAAGQLPILMLTARGDEVDKVLGLEMGADDYLPKPFSSRELVARLRAILRRAHAVPETASSHLRVSDIQMNSATREVLQGEKRLEFTGAEFDVLALLLKNAGEIVARETISQNALGRTLSAYDRSIDVHISNLRRKLGPAPDGGERIKAVRGIGYLYARSHEEKKRVSS
jgi:two-component system response regulator CpxR